MFGLYEETRASTSTTNNNSNLTYDKLKSIIKELKNRKDPIIEFAKLKGFDLENGDFAIASPDIYKHFKHSGYIKESILLPEGSFYFVKGDNLNLKPIL